MTGVEIVTNIVQILVSGIKDMGAGIGAGLSSLVQSIFMTTTESTTSLSVFGTLVIVFAAIALSMSLTRWCVSFVTSLGQRNR